MRIRATVTIGYTDYNFGDNPISAIAFAEEAAKYCEDTAVANVYIAYIRDEEGDNEHDKDTERATNWHWILLQ